MRGLSVVIHDADVAGDRIAFAISSLLYQKVTAIATFFVRVQSLRWN